LQVFYTALPDTIGFIGALVAVFTGFGLAHFLAYGDDVYDFRTLSASFVSLYRMVNPKPTLPIYASRVPIPSTVILKKS